MNMDKIKHLALDSFYIWVALTVIVALPAYFVLSMDIDGITRISLMLGAISLILTLISNESPEKLNSTTRRILDFYKLKDVSHWKVSSRSFPAYQYVDIYNAISSEIHNMSELLVDKITEDENQNNWYFHSVSQEHRDKAMRDVEISTLDISHDEPLVNILANNYYHGSRKSGQTPNRLPFSTGYRQEEYFPEDVFWLTKVTAIETRLIIRFKNVENSHKSSLEVAGEDEQKASDFISRVVKLANEKSIYKYRKISLNYATEVRDEFGDVQSDGYTSVVFLPENEVTRENIVIDDNTQQLLDAAVFDFHKRRETLLALNVPGTRGLLFHGPPGTGKTYTCKYISSCLDNVTTIVASGKSLLHIKSICNLARSLQPSLVILEDVDLAFADRSINAYKHILGDLLDELDGFQDKEAIIYIMTTNDLKRLESAIKDRPGRVSQCIYFGPPGDELREQYLKSFLSNYAHSQVELGRVVKMTDGVSQVFLKELVHRAIQISSRKHDDPSMLQLTTDDFAMALKTLKEGSEHQGGKIIGFHVD
ncbi:MAG: hypothetical protein Tsb009_28880 [Planctomycetaceae bacterium]